MSAGRHLQIPRRQALAGAAGLALCRPAMAGSAIRIGALRGPQAELLAVAAGLSKAQKLNVETVASGDAAGLLAALRRGELDATASHNAVELHSLADSAGLVTAFATVTLPIGIYARRVKSIAQLRDFDTIVLPAPAAENARARVLLYNYRLLFAHEDDGLAPDLSNIVNPRKFVLRTAQIGALAGQLNDKSVSAVLLPYGAAVAAGLRPGRDSIGLEDGKSPYTQVVAVRAADRDSPWLAQFARIFQSRDMRRAIYQKYGDAVEPPW